MLYYLSLMSVAFVVDLVSFLWHGYVLSLLWSWFVVPTLYAPALSLPAATGMALIVGYLTAHSSIQPDESGDEWARLGTKLCPIVLRPALALVLGAIFRLWM